MNATRWPDMVSFGGWGLDLHPADGVYSPKPGFTHWQARSIYPIPYRAMYSRNVANLFLAGRIVGSTHVAFGSTRVMGTCAYAAQAVGTAAAICARDGVLPRDVSSGPRLGALQLRVRRNGHHLPGMPLTDDPDDLVRQAPAIDVSSTFTLDSLPAGAGREWLYVPRAQLLPVAPGPMPRVTIRLDAHKPTNVRAEVRVSSRPDAFVPDVALAGIDLALEAGLDQPVTLDFPGVSFDRHRYAFLHLSAANDVAVQTSPLRVTGVLALMHHKTQSGVEHLGIDCFDMYRPPRRPGGENFAMQLDPPLGAFEVDNLRTGFDRPTHRPNAWCARPDDPNPSVTVRWDRPQRVRQVDVAFDADWDHPVESVLWGHPEREMPFCVKRFRLLDDAGRELARVDDHHHSSWRLVLPDAIETRSLRLELLESRGTPPAVFSIRAYERPTAPVVSRSS
jgi:hypothetical protein